MYTIPIEYLIDQQIQHWLTDLSECYKEQLIVGQIGAK